MPLTGYQRYLLALSRDLPVINSVGYKDSDGHYYESADQLSPERRARVEDYQILQYCNIFDPQSMADAYFCLE